INCTSGTGDACGVCLPCRKMEHGTHPDLREFFPTKKSRIIPVETVNEINELTAYRSHEGGYRVCIIHEMDRMMPPAQNHFLKTLEEPPSATAFILLTEYPRRLLPTILSRCQQVRFGALKRSTVTDLLRAQRDVPGPVAAAIAAISQGQMSRALDLVDTPKREEVLEAASQLAQGRDPLVVSEDFVRKIRAASEALMARTKAEMQQEVQPDLSREEREEQKEEMEALLARLVRQEVMEYLYLLKAWYRDELVFAASGNADHVWNRDQAARMQERQVPQEPDKLAEIEKAWLYIERNLRVERVFRDLFFTLAV
ncbi:MAG: hypothetical protein HYV26_16660, partial [Candidatus Hydrogenedentes bacterium]|nr:hypothetical protein [Candidatus Hydrogenedentota bacterium]